MDKKQKTRRALSWAGLILSIFNAMLYFSMRHIWSGVRAMFGIASLPLILMAVLTAVALATVVAFKKRRAAMACFVINIVFFGGLMFMLYMAFGSWPYILREFLLLALGMAGVGLLGLLIWRFPLGKRQFRAVKAVVILLVCAVSFFAAYGVGIGGIQDGPAVFAVGENYQIVFTTRADSVAWAEVGGTRYYDAYSGSDRSETTVHKIEVPMTALDAAREYTLGARTMIMRGPYDGIFGRTFSQQVAFRPVEESDGMQYYVLADSHDYTRQPSETAGYFGDALDFLILAGDHASYLTHEADLTRALVLAHRVTGGQRPVVYARGNHEVKGSRANELHRYVGADGDKFYFTFRLGSLWGVVLDAGEDHGDDWWEFYGTAHFDDYRAEQTAFLRSLNSDAAAHYDAPGIETRLAICHYPINFLREDDFMGALKQAWAAQLNQMDLTMMVSGHMHTIFWTTPEMPDGTPLAYHGSDTAIGQTHHLNFPAYVCSQQSDVQFPPGGGAYVGRALIGMAAESVGGETHVWFTNSRQQVIELADPWDGTPLSQPMVVPQKESG